MLNGVDIFIKNKWGIDVEVLVNLMCVDYDMK